MVIRTATDFVTDTASAIGGVFGGNVIRIGVTGLSRAGKTVFITSLVANLLNRSRMPQLHAAPRIEAAYLQSQPDDTVPRFPYENHLNALLGSTPYWPEGTRTISELRLSLKLRPEGMLSHLQKSKTVHLDIVDYPGEWLLDISLLDQTYDDWAAQALNDASKRAEAKPYLEQLHGIDGHAPFDDVTATGLAQSYAAYLQEARENGFTRCTPGRFLLPGELAGSPVLTFAPLPKGDAPKKSLRAEMRRRFEAYKSKVVRPFFRTHFARIDRQIVLVDVLQALAQGPGAVHDLQTAMADILTAFRPGRNSFLSEILNGKRVEKILFAATKADHVHHTQHGALSGFVSAMTAAARDQAKFRGARASSMSIAALRTTTETELPGGIMAVQGVSSETGKRAAFYPGEIPNAPSTLLAQAREGAADWAGHDFAALRFNPPPMALADGEAPPHIRMDKAVEFLIGDKL
ncbi:MAG: YcjX family protein [Planktomarina sp.]